MSVAAESPPHSSSSTEEDFAALLDAELESAFQDDDQLPQPAQEDEDGKYVKEEDKEKEEQIVKRRKVEVVEVVSELTPDALQVSEKKKVTCPPHPVIIKGLCVICGQTEDDDGSGIAISYIHKDLKVQTSEIDRLRGIDLKNLLQKKKLILVLDLDHTLLNSTRFVDLTPQEEYLLKDLDSTQGDSNQSLFKLNGMHLLTKLRPYVHTFLREASNMFEMYIYTMAERSYALEIARIIDPGGVYFNSKVICQSDCTQRHQKGLDVVLGAESTVLILDDTEMVWQKHRENLILMERYHYFASSSRQFNSNQESLSIAKKDESEAEGILASVLAVLRRVHEVFFDPDVDTDLSNRDVRPVLRKVRREILRGCKVVFSRLFPSEARGENHRIWKMCEQLGATCCTEADSSITHIIANDKGTQKAKWAVQNEKFLVNPGWVEGAYYLWRRLPEKDFAIG